MDIDWRNMQFFNKISPDFISELNEKEITNIIVNYNNLVDEYEKLQEQFNKTKLDSAKTLSFADLEKLDNYQIRYTTILQNCDGACNFYEEGKILDLTTNADHWVNPELIKLFLKTVQHYGVTRLKQVDAQVKEKINE